MKERSFGIKNAARMFLRGFRFGKEQVNIQPGEYIVTNADVIVSTVLGSCISVCFYSDSSSYFGMNHFVLPLPGLKCETEKEMYHCNSAFYGKNSMEIVLNALQQSGIQKRHLKAKVFGGGNVLSIKTTDKTVGEQNVAFVLDYLKKENIPIVACSVGGDYGRKIIYFPESHEVLLQKLSHSQNSTVIKEQEALVNSKQLK